MKKLLTLAIVHQGDKVLLGMRKRGFGAGRFNGFGGKIEDEESIEAAARRELFEEAGITADNLNKIGIIDFEFKEKEDILEVHLFKIKKFSGEIIESEEMRPEWFSVDSIPFSSMWSDDIHWFNLFLNDVKFKAKFLFDQNDMVIKYDIIEGVEF